MNANEMAQKIWKMFPNAQFDERDGELVIWTGFRIDKDNELVPTERA